jgi:hypothetical protein
MRYLAPLLCVLALVAGCTSGAGTTPGSSTTPSSAATPAPTDNTTAVPTQAASATPATVRARVTFDGTHCVYTGPTVIPSPSELTIEYAPTPAQEGSSVYVFAAASTTTEAAMARLDQDPNSGIGEGYAAAPDFVDPATFHARTGSGSWAFPLQVLQGPDGMKGTFDKYIVGCITSIPGKPAPGYALLQLVEATPSATPTAAP